MPDTGRLYSCARCRAQVVVCRRCDRGQIYCFEGCAARARGERQRAAGRRYQASRRGRFAHAERSRRYRLRRRTAPDVTHQGSIALATGDLLRIEVTAMLPETTAQAVTDEVMMLPATPVPVPVPCRRCGSPCAGGLRLGFVRHHCRPAASPPVTHTIDRALHRSFDDHRP